MYTHMIHLGKVNMLVNAYFLFLGSNMLVVFVLVVKWTLNFYFEPWACLLCLCWKQTKLSICILNFEHACYVCVGSKRNSQFLFWTLSMLVVFVLEANQTLIFYFEPWACLLCLCWKQTKLSIFVSRFKHACCVCFCSKMNSQFLYLDSNMFVVFIFAAKWTLNVC